MKRLIELQEDSPLIERAQELIAAAEPIDASQARAERMRRALDQPSRSTAAAWTRLPALAIAGFVLLFGASSFAALRLWTAATETDEPPAAAPQRDTAQGARTEPRARGREFVAPSAAPTLAADAPAELRNGRANPPPSASRFQARPSRAQRTERREPTETASPREAAPPTELETAPEPEASPAPPAPKTNSELVVRAVRALRREGDPARAAQLLDAYRARRAPDPLAEEVLALQIEAALANGDSRARRFAQEYVARYPVGRYAAIARRALAEQGP